MRIRNLILSIIFVLLLMIIYMNANKIYVWFNNLITQKNVTIIPQANSYKRKYSYEKFSNEEDYIPYSKSDLENIFYNILNNGFKEFTFYCPSEYENCSKDVETISSDVTLMSNISGYVSPFNAYSLINTTVSSYNEVYVNVTKKYSDEEIEQVKNKMNEINNNLQLEGKTKEEKLKIFHDYLIKNTIYDEVFANTKKSVYNSSKANGALIDGHAVCGGYTDAIALYLDELNIPNIIISNYTNTWNMAYIDDVWLHIDSTWNDTENDKYEYEFYLITTEELQRIDLTEHQFDSKFFIEAY